MKFREFECMYVSIDVYYSFTQNYGTFFDENNNNIRPISKLCLGYNKYTYNGRLKKYSLTNLTV